MTTSARRLMLVSMLVATFGTVACSGTKSADQSSDPSASAPVTTDSAAASGAVATSDAAATSAAVANGGDSNSNGDDPCQKLTLSDVQPFFGAMLTVTKDDNLIGSAAGCRFHTTDDHTSFEVITVTGTQAERYYDGSLPQVGGSAAKVVPGIGDKAVRGVDDVQVHTLKGDVFCMFSIGKDARDSLKGFESYAGKPIPDDLAGPEAEKLAAICTKLFN
jgi:hypothetical protein